METCSRHGEITKCLDSHTERIRELELADIETKTELKNLISSIKELTSWMKLAVIGMCGLGATFIIQYIQNL